MNEIAVHNGVNFGSNGLEIQKDLSVDEWMTLGHTLNTMQGAIQWWIGDWLNHGEQKYGDKYSQALEHTKYSYQALANMKWVASKVEISYRKENLSWKHHFVVTTLSKEDQKKYLALAEKENLSSRALADKISTPIAKKECKCKLKDMEEYILYKCDHGKEIIQKLTRKINP